MRRFDEKGAITASETVLIAIAVLLLLIFLAGVEVI